MGVLLPPLPLGCGDIGRLTRQADPISVTQLPHVWDYPGSRQTFGNWDAPLGLLLGWYLRVWLDLDVVLGDKALAAEQLSLVPVLVIFHVEDLRWERSREMSAWLPFPWERG